MVSLRISNLTHEFDDRMVLRGLNCDFTGSCLVVTGPNGSGKSTLLKIIAGLLTPVEGDVVISVDGQVISPFARRDFIGMCAPDLHLYPELSPRENLRFLLTAKSVPAGENVILHALDRVGLGDRADDPVKTLSSGLRRRAAIASAFVHKPLVLLLDEPSSNLDEPGKAMLASIIEDQRRCGMVVIATNERDEADFGEERLVLGDQR